MINQIMFEHGTETCVVEPGKFCEWMWQKKFGTVMICHLFEDIELEEVDDGKFKGWIGRCGQCKERFGQ
jgi:hypothetical protein